MSDDTVAIQLHWEGARVVDPTVLLGDTQEQNGRVHAVPRALADEFLAVERHHRALLDRVYACARYTTIPARKLVLGDTTVAEKTWESR